jgi:hypothetical protein
MPSRPVRFPWPRVWNAGAQGAGAAVPLLAEMRKHRCALSSRRCRRSGAAISDNVTLTYVGAYRVTVPAGTFDAAPLKWDFKGKIGRASVEDIQARFAPCGMVAAAEKYDVAAFLIYNDNTKVGKILAQKP